MSLTDVLLKKKVLPLFFQKHRISIILIVLELRSRMTLTEKNILGLSCFQVLQGVVSLFVTFILTVHTFVVFFFEK